MRAIPLRRSLSLAALSVAAFLGLSCGGDSGGGPPEPSSVVVTPGTDTLFALNSTQAFTAEVLDDAGTPIPGAVVVWSSSDLAILSVNAATGVATALQNGAADVIATIGDLQGSAPVTVAQVPTTVTITPSTASFTFVGDTQTFTATVLDAGGSPVTPVQRIWTLNDNTVAVIDSNGLARAKGAGIAMVTVVAIGPGGAKAAYAAITATQPVALLYFRTQPSDVVAGEALDPAVQIEVRDSGGAVVTGYAGAITLVIDSGPVSAVLRGTRTVNAINGVVSWSGVYAEKSGGYRLRATGASLAPAISTGFNVAPTMADHLTLLAPPAVAVVAGAPTGIVYSLDDRFGNRSRDSLTMVTLSLVAGPSGATIGGVPFSLRAPGLAPFPNSFLPRVGLGYRLRASGPGLGGDTTALFQVIPGAAARMQIIQDSGMQVLLSIVGQVPVIVEVQDSFGNKVTSGSHPVTLSATGWPYSAPAGKGQRVLAGGLTATNGTLNTGSPVFTRPGLAALIASSPGLIPDTGSLRARRLNGTSDLFVGGEVTCLWSVSLCAGRNGSGELGVDVAVLPRDSVVLLPDSNVQVHSVSIGPGVVCGVRPIFPGPGSTIVCRGANDEGQLGIGTTGSPRPWFGPVTGSSGWTAVAVGGGHACAIVADSTLACWGRNDRGQLGRGTISPSEPTPAPVTGATKYKRIAAGKGHTCAVAVAGGMFCWGANGSGQLGDSTQTDRSGPTVVQGAHLYTHLALGDAFTCGAKTDGGAKLMCWGDNSLAQLGDAGAGARRLYPGLVVGAVNDLPYQLVSGAAHSCAIFNSTFACWGDNGRGQIGTGSAGGTVASLFAPNFSGFVGGVAYNAVGTAHSCALAINPGSLIVGIFCWGANNEGQLGDGTTADRATPTLMIQ